jgi:RNA recognition motif-containing protein
LKTTVDFIEVSPGQSNMLPYFCTETDLNETFKKIGNILNVRVIRNKETRRTFVDFEYYEDAQTALNEMNGQLISRTDIKVNLKKKSSCFYNFIVDFS